MGRFFLVLPGGGLRSRALMISQRHYQNNNIITGV
jgi:hypothetical protein